MKSPILLVGFLVSLTLAQRALEGFEYLGPVPSSLRFASNSRKAYYVSADKVTWNNAFEACLILGGQLATPFSYIQDNALRQYMVTRVSGIEYIWLGAKSGESTTYGWATVDLPLTYTKIDINCTGSNTCMTAGHSKYLEWFWCATNCDQLRRYVCEL